MLTKKAHVFDYLFIIFFMIALSIAILNQVKVNEVGYDTKALDIMQAYEIEVTALDVFVKTQQPVAYDIHTPCGKNVLFHTETLQNCTSQFISSYLQKYVPPGFVAMLDDDNLIVHSLYPVISTSFAATPVERTSLLEWFFQYETVELRKHLQQRSIERSYPIPESLQFTLDAIDTSFEEYESLKKCTLSAQNMTAVKECEPYGFSVRVNPLHEKDTYDIDYMYHKMIIRQHGVFLENFTYEAPMQT
ncbi:MAG: hypothetical protein ACMXYC_04585 [Candidatus Woesearchaeota archaeon]